MAEYIDLRKLDKNELFKLRKAVVRLKEKGRSGREIELLTRVRKNRISEIWQLYLKGGIDGLRPGERGRKPGEKTLLGEREEREIKRIMTEKTPDELGMPFSLWTGRIAGDFIKREYDVRLPMRSMTNYFKRWGFVNKAPTSARELMGDEFAAVVRRAKSENVGIYWYCETIAPKGPREKTGALPKNKNMYAAVTARGTARFAFFEGGITQEKFIGLMDRLIRYADRKVFFIAADKKPFRGGKVRAWLKSRADRIEVFYHPL